MNQSTKPAAMSKPIRELVVAMLVPMDHAAPNNGEKPFGNQTSVKMDPLGRPYVSGQSLRSVIANAMRNLMASDPRWADYFMPNGDGTSGDILRDVRADAFGVLLLPAKEYPIRRMSPLSATPLVSVRPVELGRDLTVRFNQNPTNEVKSTKVEKERDRRAAAAAAGPDDPEVAETTKKQDQAFLIREYVPYMDLGGSVSVDLSRLGVTERFTYGGNLHLDTEYVKSYDDAHRLMRALLILEGVFSMTDFANSARNAVSGEPQKVLIVLDPMHRRKVARYFQTDNLVERERFLIEVEARGGRYFLGDDTDANAPSVFQAYTQAVECLSASEIFSLGRAGAAS